MDVPAMLPVANAAVQSLLDQWVAEGSEIGIHVVAYHGGVCVVDAWAGYQDLGKPVDPGSTLFNVFSVCKAVTATCVHIQADRGLIEYDAPLARYWPRFTGDGREQVTVHHVLTHRSGMHKLPADITVEQICDWDYMISLLERTSPAFEPGSVSGYQSMTFGWLLGEIVRRTDPKGRSLGQFVREEIGIPLGAPDLHIGLPPALDQRVAVMDGSSVNLPENPAYRETCPVQVDLMPEPFGRERVRHAEIPAVGGIFSARSCARFWAMLANGGALDGVPLLSESRLRALSVPRERPNEADLVFFGMPVPISRGGFWMGGSYPPVSAMRNPAAICHPGMGGSIGFADLDRGLSFAFCHNKLFDAQTPEDDHRTVLADAIRAALDIEDCPPRRASG